MKAENLSTYPGFFIFEDLDTTRQKPIPLGEFRIVKRFLLFPMKLDGVWKWMQIATIQQQFYRVEYETWCHDPMSGDLYGIKKGHYGQWFDYKYINAKTN